jgi:hypothetical protein
MDRRSRDVVHGAQFELSCRKIAEVVSLEKLQQLLLAVKWLISRSADDFERTVDGISVYRYAQSDMYPGLVFYFTIDSEDQCTLRFVTLAEP